MRAQKDVATQEEMRKFIKETQESHPLPTGVIWMVCNEKSKHFVMMGLN